jgi:hypothetical protein
MNRFTLRSALVLAVVLLLAGATTSFGQVIFSASAGNPQVRIGGMSETVGDTTLTANGGNVPGTVALGPTQMVLTMTYSTAITNKSLVGTNVVGNCLAGGNASIAIPAVAPIGITVTINNITCAAVTNITWAASGNTLTVTILNVAAAGGITFLNGVVNSAITVHGVRINAAGLGIPPALPTVSVFVNTAPSANIQLAAGSTSLTVGYLINALGSVTRLSGSTNTNDSYYNINNAAVTSTFGAPTTPGTMKAATGTCGGTACNAYVILGPKSAYTNCGFRGIPQGASAGGTVVITGDEPTIDRSGANNFGSNGGSNSIGIKIMEGYPGALTSKTDETNKSNAAEVDNGTRIRIDFSGLPAQVVVGAPIRVLASLATTVSAVSGLSMDLFGNTQCAVGACLPHHTALADVRSASGGAVTVEYEVTANTGGGAGTASGIVIPIFLWQATSPVDLTTINISVRLGPILGSTIVRFSDQQTASTATVAVTSCSTEIFYPFVTNTAGFDTGIYVLNGGQARGGNNGQSGTCTARFFDGSTTGTTAVKTSTLPTLGPGQSFSFTASDATLGKPGFGNGYVQVTCNFEGGHGAAYVTFGFGTAAVGSAPPGTLYLALIDDSRGSRSSR